MSLIDLVIDSPLVPPRRLAVKLAVQYVPPRHDLFRLVSRHASYTSSQQKSHENTCADLSSAADGSFTRLSCAHCYVCHPALSQRKLVCAGATVTRNANVRLVAAGSCKCSCARVCMHVNTVSHKLTPIHTYSHTLTHSINTYATLCVNTCMC